MSEKLTSTVPEETPEKERNQIKELLWLDHPAEETGPSITLETSAYCNGRRYTERLIDVKHDFSDPQNNKP